jgi:hypothetical protein
MIARAAPDVAATIGWMGENEVVVAQLSGGPKESFGNAQVDFQRERRLLTAREL